VAAELPTGRGPTGEEGQARRKEGALREKRGRPAVKRGWPAGTRGPFGEEGQARRDEGALRGRGAGPPGRGDPSGEEHALLAWPGGGIRGCRRGGANMGWRRAEFGAPCWRGPTVD